MPYTVTISCEKSGAATHCGWVSWDTLTPSAPPPAAILQDMAERGWAERDGKHYCPRHDPGKVGEMVPIGFGYVEVAPGVHVRWPGAHQEGDSMLIEVRQTPGQPQQASIDAEDGTPSEQHGQRRGT